MAKIHKLIEPGAEAYLPFLLARERSVRNRRESGQESMSGGYAMRYDFGDVEAELRMTGGESFVVLRNIAGKNASTAWVAYPFSLSLQFSRANSWPKLALDSPMPENPGPKPVPPIEQPYPKKPVVESNPHEFPPPPPCPVQPVEPNFPLASQGCLSWWYDYTYRDITNRNRARMAQAEWDAHYSASQRGFPFVTSPWYSRPADNAFEGEAQISFAGATSGNGVTYSLVGWEPKQIDEGAGWYSIVYYNELYISGFSASALPMVKYWDAMGSWGEACKAIQNANGAAHSAYQHAVAEWVIKANAWNQAQQGIAPDPTVCYPHHDSVRQAASQNRPTQIETLRNEVLRGVHSLPVFNGAARPVYVPLEWPAEKFTTGTESNIVANVWVGQNRYESVASRTSPGGADTRGCGSSLTTMRLFNSFIDAEPTDSKRMATNKRAYGFSVTAEVPVDHYAKEPPPDSGPLKAVFFAQTYGDWLRSPREKYPLTQDGVPVSGFAGGRNVNFDLTVGRSGLLRLLCFEFRVYDTSTGKWYWSPSPRIAEIPAVASCVTGYCISTDRSPPPPPPEEPPPTADGIVSGMRVLTAVEHEYAPGAEPDTTDWSEPYSLVLPDSTLFALDFTGLTFDKRELPTGVAVMYGVESWMMPAVPSLMQATHKKHISEDPPATHPLSATAATSVVEWLVKEGTKSLVASVRASITT